MIKQHLVKVDVLILNTATIRERCKKHVVKLGFSHGVSEGGSLLYMCACTSILLAQESWEDRGKLQGNVVAALSPQKELLVV